MDVSKKAAILLVDDNTTALNVRKLLLERAGYRVLAATTGEEGLALFADAAVDVVVTDYYLPDINGDELCRRMKRLRPHIPLILLSGAMVMDDCADYSVVKGQNPTVLLSRIESVLRGNAPPGRDPQQFGGSL